MDKKSGRGERAVEVNGGVRDRVRVRVKALSIVYEGSKGTRHIPDLCGVVQGARDNKLFVR